MTYGLKRGVLMFPLVAPVLLSACVSQSSYDALQAQYQQAQQQNAALSKQVAADKAQICRLQGAIKYTVNSDLLFRPGSYEMSDRGKQIIAGFAAKLAPTQQNKILVSGYTDNAPVGPALARQGITSNEILSQKRAENVMEYIISQGVKPDLISAQGFRRLKSSRSERHATGPRPESSCRAVACRFQLLTHRPRSRVPGVLRSHPRCRTVALPSPLRPTTRPTAAYYPYPYPAPY